MKKLYFVYIVNEDGKVIKMYATKSENKAHQYCDNYKATDGAFCVLEYLIAVSYKDSDNKTKSQTLANYYA